MPCDSVTLQEIVLTNALSPIMKAAFEHLNIKITSMTENRIRGRSVDYEEIVWTKGKGLAIRKAEGLQINDIVKAYSIKAIDYVAKKTAWIVQEIEENVFKLTKSNQDTMQITILKDGILKIETDKISQANHMTAEAFMRYMAQVCGGPQKRKHKQGFIGELKHQAQHFLQMGHNH